MSLNTNKDKSNWNPKICFNLKILSYSKANDCLVFCSKCVVYKGYVKIKWMTICIVNNNFTLLI